MMRFIDSHHRKLVHEPHGYLWVLGVAPAVQGRRGGSDFLTPVLHRADADGVLCYVETQSEANVAFYEHCSCDVVLTAAELVCRFSLWFAYPVVPRPPRRCGGGESVLAPGETDKLKPHLSQEGRGRREENWKCSLGPLALRVSARPPPWVLGFKRLLRDSPRIASKIGTMPGR